MAAVRQKPSTPAPFLKWAGGKSAIVDDLRALFPRDVAERVYREPFLGGGAVFFHLRPARAVLSDALGDLIDTYEAVRSETDALLAKLDALAAGHSKEQFYEVRARFNAERAASRVDRAAWLIYLNKTCFNGLFRTNQRGHFNVPMGDFKRPKIADGPRLRAAAAALRGVTLRKRSFTDLLKSAKAGDFIYLDPPYVPVTKTASFSSYAEGDFTDADQVALADVVRRLHRRGCLFALSNSDMPRVRELYADFDIKVVPAPRAISAKASTRGSIDEIVVRNTANYPDGGKRRAKRVVVPEAVGGARASAAAKTAPRRARQAGGSASLPTSSS